MNNETNRVAPSELRQYIENFEGLEREKQDIAEHQKALMKEASGNGYDTKVMRKLIKLRAMDQDKRAEEDAILAMYEEATGA